MSQWVRAHAALAEDLGLVPSTYTVAAVNCNSSSWRSDTFPGFHRDLYTCGADTYMEAKHSWTHKIKIKHPLKITCIFFTLNVCDYF